MVSRAAGVKDFICPWKWKYMVSVFLAVCGVIFGFVPYVMIYRFLISLSQATCRTDDVVIQVAILLGCLLMQIVCHSCSTAISHKTTFSVLEHMQITMTEKILRMPLGYVQGKGSGYFKDVLIDQTGRLEYPLAHALPETTSGVLLPLVMFAFLFFVDWRMGLAVFVPSMATLVLYLPMYMGIMNEFANTYYSALAAMNNRVIEFITGIKEIKIFRQADEAYEKYEASIDAYRDSTLRLYNRMYFVTSPALTLLSSILVSVLSVGGILYSSGELSASVFLYAVILSMGVGAPLLKFTEFMDNFYHIKNGMNVIREILIAPELPQRSQKPV